MKAMTIRNEDYIMDVVVSEEDFMAMDFMDTPDLVTLDIHIMAMALDTHITHIVGSVFFF